MIIWLNGTFGVGKTTTAGEMIAQDPSLRLFDPEWVGYMLTANLGDRDIQDFQDLDAWRRLVPIVAHEIVELTGQRLLAVQSVLVEEYWLELRRGLEALGHPVFHVVLDADSDVLRERAETDVADHGAAQWRIDHLPAYEAARTWLFDKADIVVDTSDMTPGHVAATVLAAL